MREYLNLVSKVMTLGEEREDRTGVGTVSLFGERLEIDLRKGFPLLTTKRVNFKAVLAELLWFLRGSVNTTKFLNKYTNIWDPWVIYKDPEDLTSGNIGPLYGKQWRFFGAEQCTQCNGRGYEFGANWCSSCDGEGFGLHGNDQIASLLKHLQETPLSRRHVVSGWNPIDQEKQPKALPPCHILFQVYISQDRQHLDLHLYQRSADLAIGVPFNIASYATLMHILCGYLSYPVRGKRGRSSGSDIVAFIIPKPRRLVISYGDVHIYRNHLEGLREQCQRPTRTLPGLIFDTSRGISELGLSDFSLVGYNPAPAIKFDVAV